MTCLSSASSSMNSDDLMTFLAGARPLPRLKTTLWNKRRKKMVITDGVTLPDFEAATEFFLGGIVRSQDTVQGEEGKKVKGKTVKQVTRSSFEERTRTYKIPAAYLYAQEVYHMIQEIRENKRRSLGSV
jgi:hypothetical protein